jgi:hypothetical protein
MKGIDLCDLHFGYLRRTVMKTVLTFDANFMELDGHKFA